MANSKLVDIIKLGAHEWNLWRQKNPTIPIDLREIDLRNTNLRNFRLTSANLSGADLRGTDLSGSRLNKAQLHKADCSGARLHSTNLQDADLSDTRFINACLIEAYLMGANAQHSLFKEADLQHADLSGANFKTAYLDSAQLVMADLTNTDLSGASLNEANLRRATICGTNFSKADLRGTNFSSAWFKDANFSAAILGYGVFADNDIRSLIGLEEVYHDGSTSIDIATIYQSEGTIPEVFLRGCGVPENFIEYMRSLTGSAFDYYSCFISYSHADKAFARRLHDALQGQGIRCWLDEHQLLPGDDKYDVIDRGLRGWDKILLCASEHSLKSWWVEKEMNTAFTKEQDLQKARGKKVLALIPLNLDGYMFSDGWTSGKAEIVRERIAADFTGWEKDNNKFEQEFQRVLRALRTGDAGREPVPTSKL